MVKELDFMECASCAKKPGMPRLCDSCLHNRHAIYELRRQLEEAKAAPKPPPPPTTEEVICRLLDADGHTFSSRPCQTCIAVSALVNRPFGCSKVALDRKQREQDNA